MSSEKEQIKNRIHALRQRMNTEACDAYIVFSADTHLSEYLTPYWQVRAWLSGFTGSAGTLIITNDYAGLWTDGRYWEMAENQLSDTGIELNRWHDNASHYLNWLSHFLTPNSTIAFDGQTISASDFNQLQNVCVQHQFNLNADLDLISSLWDDRPELPTAKIYEHAPQFCSETRTKKLARLRLVMSERSITHHIISTLDDIAWLTNLRGSDIEYNPVFLSYMLITQEIAYLFVNTDKLSHELQNELKKEGIDIAYYDQFYSAISNIPSDSIVLFDLQRTTIKSVRALNKNITLINEINPTTLFKSIKSEDDIENIQQAMIQDGIALTEFFAWLDDAILSNQSVTELTIDEKLTEYRKQRAHYVSNSFVTIAGFNQNGAMPHYQATMENHENIDGDGLLLIDSGGQYQQGTTDITRVVAIGHVTNEQKKDYTFVLKSHIAMASCVYPTDIPGQLIDAIGRAPLWQEQVDFAHGTGHGIGYFLNVHEGPQSLSYRSPMNAHSGLKNGMITSNEPAIYRPNQWGIRLENLMVSRQCLNSSDFGAFSYFETLTLCPFDMKCIDEKFLNQNEKKWLNQYHQKVYGELHAHLSARALKWLEKNTKNFKE